MGIYFYTSGARNLGVGVDDLAFRSVFGKPVFGPYSKGYVTERTLFSQKPGYVKLAQDYVPVSLVGNGQQLSGRIELQRLAQMQKG
jgi:hypothetical protein